MAVLRAATRETVGYSYCWAGGKGLQPGNGPSGCTGPINEKTPAAGLGRGWARRRLWVGKRVWVRRVSDPTPVGGTGRLLYPLYFFKRKPAALPDTHFEIFSHFPHPAQSRPPATP